jgi:hypothetical protein
MPVITRDAQTTSRQGRLTQKIFKLRGRRVNIGFNGNFWRSPEISFGPPLRFFTGKFFQGATPPPKPLLWTSLIITEKD